MTVLIQTQAITKSYGPQSLFNQLSINLYEQDRVGLIGPNGAGKSTFLKLLMGEELPDDGRMIRHGNTHLVYLPQQDDFDPNRCIRETLFGNEVLSPAEQAHLLRTLDCLTWLGDLDQTIETLSGGYRKRVAIVRCLLQKPDLWLLDEPTNHLDLDSILWLERRLKETECSWVVISHDRTFLNHTANRIIELNPAYPEGYLSVKGNYATFLSEKITLLEHQRTLAQKLTQKMRREEDWLQRMPKARTTKAQYRIDQAAALAEELKTLNRLNTSLTKPGIEFLSTGRQTQILIETKGLKLAQNDRVLIRDLDIRLSPGQCLGIVGPNGSGKTTLLRLLSGEITPTGGEVIRAPQLKFIYFKQDRSQLSPDQTLQNTLAPEGDSVFYRGRSVHVAAFAQQFLFSRDQLRQPVSSLSGGEQARLLIAKLMCQTADVLLLDEPTNDLDIPTLEVMEESLSDFPGLVVLVTHDRFMLERLGQGVLYLDGTGNAILFADYAQYEQQRIRSDFEPEKNIKTQAPAKEGIRLIHTEKKELDRLPEKISKQEARLHTLEETMQSADVACNPERLNALFRETETIKAELDALYARWLELESKHKT